LFSVTKIVLRQFQLTQIDEIDEVLVRIESVSIFSIPQASEVLLKSAFPVWLQSVNSMEFHILIDLFEGDTTDLLTSYLVVGCRISHFLFRH